MSTPFDIDAAEAHGPMVVEKAVHERFSVHYLAHLEAERALLAAGGTL